MSQQQYKTAFIGCGHRARAHAFGVRADSRCKVVATSDINPKAAEAMIADYGFAGASVYTDYRAMLKEQKPDVVVASLWTPLHLPVFRDCAEAGVKAVLSEKPMAPTWGESLEMAAIAERTGCQLTFCHQRRFARGNLLVRKLIEDGTFGKIERMDLYAPPNLLDCGTHTIDQAMSFNGESPAKWVLGAVDTSKLIKWFDVGAEGMAIGTIVFQNGVRSFFQFGGQDLDMWGGVRVHGSEGFIEVLWDGPIKRAVRYSEPTWKPPVVPEDKSDDHMAQVVRNAIDCIGTGREPELSHRKALRVTETIFALYESVRRHAHVELPLTDVTDNPFLSMLAAGRFGEKKLPEKV